ncbi:MAG: ribonuclease H [Chloroflexota bacterium]|nr:MAG: ribonuclease H [Chloroflexota bacterium]
MNKKQKYYVVWKGRRAGIFSTWAEAEAQVKGFAGAQFKAFSSRAEADAAFRNGRVATEPGSVATPRSVTPSARWHQLRLIGIPSPIQPSYCADAACAGNPGVMEYRAVKTETGEILFARGPFPEGTNNIGEFLALVETLQILRERNDASPIYSDSRNAINWVKAKTCKTQLSENSRNAELFERIERAEEWLRENSYANKILKWDTENWGEIPADYGRK